MDAYIIDAKRTAIGRSHEDKGAFRSIRADEILALLMKDACSRLPMNSIDDILIGCVGQHLEQGKNIARLSALLAGIAAEVPAVTINRLCASGLSAFQFGAMALHSGQANLVLAGGVEHMHHVPMTAATDYNKTLLSRYPFPFPQMGLTAEEVAIQYDVSRTEQDHFSLQSHKRAITAQTAGHFKVEILPVLTPQASIDTDQGPRADTSLDKLASLKSAFIENGTVTAGNSSPISDGASLTALATDEFCRRHALIKRAQVLDFSVVGVDPCFMGMGPVPAVRRALEKTGLGVSDIDAIELNEAFASQAIACIRELQLPEHKVNAWGGAISLGHPLGATGTRLITTLLHRLEDENMEIGLASLCVGHGQGMAVIIRRLEKG